MPDINIVVTLQSDRLPILSDLIAAKVQQAVNDTADAIRDAAAGAAPKDTGSMAEGLYVATPEGSDYADRSTAASAANPKVRLVDEVDRPDAGSATVAGAAAHSIFLELGTVHMAAQPYLAPAAEAERDAFTARIAAAISQA